MASLTQKNQANLSLDSVQPQSHLVPVDDLSKIFPDIQGQLCSRHSTLFGKLKNTFNKLYDKMQPTHYVIVKGNTHLIGTQFDEVQLSMGLENGIIILVAKTYEQANLFVNGNHMDEQLILSSQGKLEQGLYQLSEEFEVVCQSAVNDIAKDKQFGGILYIHANIPQGFYNYKNSLLTALYISILAINGQLQKYTITQLITQISKTKLVDQLFLQKQFYDYENRHFSLMVGSTTFKVPLDKNIKLLFCKMDLASCDVRHSQTNIQQIRQDKDKIIQWMSNKYGVKSFYEAFENQLQINLQNLNIEGAESDDKRQYMQLIQAELRQLKILCQYSNNHLSIESLITMKWVIDSKIREIFSEEVLDLVQNIKQKTKIEACTIVQGSYIMMAVDRRRYAELICTLRQLLHKGQLKSKSCFKLQQQLVEHRWSDDNQIGQQIFVSVPSKGIAIFDPSESIWFD